MDPEDLRQLYRQHGRAEVLRARGVRVLGHSPCPAEMGQSPPGDRNGAAGAKTATSRGALGLGQWLFPGMRSAKPAPCLTLPENHGGGVGGVSEQDQAPPGPGWGEHDGTMGGGYSKKPDPALIPYPTASSLPVEAPDCVYLLRGSPW